MILKQLLQLRNKIAVVVGLGAVLVLIVPSQAALAWSYCGGSYAGRDSCQGFFSGSNASANSGTVFDVIDGGTSAMSAGAFVDKIDAELTGSGGQDSVGAAFVIANMLGRSGPSFSSKSQGQIWARDNFARWESLVRAYDAAGFIDWSKSINTATAPRMGVDDGGYRNSAWFSDIDDTAFHNKANETITVIEIRTPNGGYFRMERKCLNLVGTLDELTTLETDATIRARSFVNNQENDGLIIDATSGSTVFEHRITTSNYGGRNHTVSYVIERSVNGDETCNAPYVAVAPGASITVTADGDTTVWGPSNVVWDRATTQQICQRLRITNRGGATLAGVNPAPRSAAIRSGSITFGVTTDPSGIVEPGAPFSMDGWVRALPAAGNSFPMTYSITYTNTIPGIAAPAAKGGLVNVGALYTDSNPFSGTIPINALAGTTICIKAEVTAPSLGRYFSGPARSDELCLKVVNKPVFHVYGGDTVAGANIDDGSCSGGPSAMIGGWNVNVPPYTGAGTAFAAYATDVIKGFATARNTTGVSAPSGLAFANLTTSGENYGGFFGRVPCMSNQWVAAPSTATSIAPGSVGLGASGVYELSGNTVGGVTINTGVQQIIYVTGNLTINGNITYNRSGWTARKNIPGVKFVVSGNIIINDNVTLLDGVYAAKGSIDTCQYPADNTMYAGCIKKLVVNGALISALPSGGINLKRTYGSVRTATPGNAAEEINYRAEVWMAYWPQVDGASNNSGKYDSITALPPVL